MIMTNISNIDSLLLHNKLSIICCISDDHNISNNQSLLLQKTIDIRYISHYHKQQIIKVCYVHKNYRY